MAENDSPEVEAHRNPLKLPANSSALRITAKWATIEQVTALSPDDWVELMVHRV